MLLIPPSVPSLVQLGLPLKAGTKQANHATTKQSGCRAEAPNSSY
jgi:hypothetical protein